MAGDIQGTTVLTGLSITSTPGSGQTSPNPAAAPALSMFGTSSVTLGSGVSMFVNSGATVTFTAGSSQVVASGATITWAPGFMLSVGTISTAASLSSLAGTGMQIGFFFAASGCSIIGRSGNTIYTFGASAVSAAAP